MTDVHDLLTRTHRALGDAGTTLDDARHDALLSGIRSRRRRRHAVEVLGVSALVLVLGAGGWIGLARDRAVPPAQSPTVSPDPTVSPEPTVTPAGDAAPVPASVAPGLVPALVMPAGMLEASTPGWVLTVQQPATLGDDGSWSVTANVVDVVDPAGTRYRVLDLPAGQYLDVVRWEAGSTTALVTTSGDAGRGAARLDLLTGEVTPLTGLPNVSAYVGRTADGYDLWDDGLGDRLVVHDGTAVVRELPRVEGAVLDPTGARVAGVGDDDGTIVTVDLATGQVTEVSPPTDALCRPVAWDGGDVIVSCEDLDGLQVVVTAVFRVAADAPGPEGEPIDLPVVQRPARAGWPLADGRIAVQNAVQVECTRGWGLFDPAAGTVQDVPVEGGFGDDTSVTVRGAGETVLVEVRECLGDGTPPRVVRYDVTTGAQVEIAAPPSDADLPAGADRWSAGTTSSVVATEG